MFTESLAPERGAVAGGSAAARTLMAPEDLRLLRDLLARRRPVSEEFGSAIRGGRS